MSLIPGSGSSPGEGNGNPLQYSCLESPMDRGAWRATVHRVTKSRTRLSVHTHTHAHKHTHTDILDKIDCIGLVAVCLDYRPNLRLTLPLMAWPGSQGPDQLPQVSAVPYIGPPDVITPLGFCDQPLSPHTGTPGVSATPTTLPVCPPVGMDTPGRIHCPREPRVSRAGKHPGLQCEAL